MKSKTETVAERARVGPHTPVVLTMKKLFRMTISSKSGLGSDMIVLDIFVRIRIELVNSKNDNAPENFYRVECFQKINIFGQIFEINEQYRKNEEIVEFEDVHRTNKQEK